MLLTPQDYGQESSLRDEITPPTSFSGEELEVAGKATASTGGSDLASVGKKVKQAYPGYSYMTDEQLGMKFLAKYGNNAPLLKAVTGDVGKPAGAEAVAEVMKQGGSDFINKGKDIASRVAIAESILDSGGVVGYRKLVPLEDLATDKEKDELADVTSLLSQIERSEKAIGTSPWGGGPVTRFIPGFARGEAGREEVETVEQVRAAYQQMISGKVLTEQEAKRLKVFLPHMGKTDTQNREDLERLREGIELNLKLFELGKREGLTPDQAYMKYGRQILGEQVVGGGDREEAGVAERAIDFLLGGALRTARDVGAGITANITEPQRKQAAEQAFAQAKELEDRAMATDNPEERVALLAEANKLHQSISQQAGEVSKSFTEDITTPYWQRGLEAGAEIGATAEIPAALSAVKKVAGEGVKKLPKLASDIGRQFGSTAQGNVIREAVVESAEAAGKKIPGDQIVKAVEKWGETAVKANPASENRITKFVEGAIKQHSGKDLTPKVAKELWDEANKGFNAAGTKGASLEASFHRTMRDVLRKELENIAPGFEKGTELIHKAMGRKTALKGFAGRAGSSAAGYVGAAAVMKALGMFEGK